MAIYAAEKAVQQLQQFFDYLGEFGGLITTNDETFWSLDLEVHRADETSKEVSIGVFTSERGDVMFDPEFTLLLTMEQDRIVKAELLQYVSQGPLINMTISADDMCFTSGVLGSSLEKDEDGLRERFSCFMHNMTELGPYLTQPKSVKKYKHTLANS